jgi:FAD synthetase
MGSRKTDPYCSNLAEVCPSDTEKGYPQFDRINPILHWSYETIWGFLRGYDLMFCSLYEKGYTYLGNRHNSIQNPKIYDQSKDAFKPAWEASGDHELLSRKK